MADWQKIDLHMHSTVSDGTDMPAEILSCVREKGIELFSLTDHDAVKGCNEIRGLLDDAGPAFINGVEFSCKDENGQYHILGYGYDPEAKPVLGLVEKGHGFRMKKVLARLQFLKAEFGFDFSKEEVDSLFSLDNPGKPHIGNLMIRHGYASSIKEAIQGYIDKAHLKSEYIRPEEAIRGILRSGGIPVLAHPSYGKGDQLILGKDMYERLIRLTTYGLLGVEAWYSTFTPRLRKQMLEFADQFDLYVTAGSDYHGTNKLVMLGDTGLKDAEEAPERLLRFMEDVKGRPGYYGKKDAVYKLPGEDHDKA